MAEVYEIRVREHLDNSWANREDDRLSYDAGACYGCGLCVNACRRYT
jgi:Pyruvate/2-oxoacid:ferredoxin oxidoreductase delta subunit